MTRDQIEERYKWKLEDIFPDDEEWEREYRETEAMIPDLAALKDSIATGASELYEGLKKIEKANFHMERLIVYSSMRKDEDGKVSKYQAQTSRAQSLAVRLGSTLAYLDPLLLEIPEETMKKYIEDPQLKEFSFELSKILRKKEHILSEKEERILAGVGEFADGPQEIFGMLNNADMDFGTIHHNGEELPLSHASYFEYLSSGDRELRKKAFQQYYDTYRKNIHTIAATYSNSVKKDVFYARERGYESAMEAALFEDDVPLSVYHDLIDNVHNNLDTMHEYMELRKKVLAADDMQMYDIYAPLMDTAEYKYSFEQARDMVLSALPILGDDYIEILKTAFTDRWIDVYETPGKRSGAYSWGVYGTHPYVLLNHRNDLDSVFTLAHELGHSMHTYFSNASQPYSTSGYVIFVAEVASTVNEILLTKYLLRTTEDKELKKYVLNHYIDQFRTTVLRQTMFAEFEMMSHEEIEKGNALTVDSMNEMYFKLNSLYHGKAMGDDRTISYEWARIPHFYNAFYVYKYATGFSCASAIVSKLESDPSMKERYRRFLCAGGSKFPIDILGDASINVGEAVDLCMKEFRRALEEFKTLV